MDGLSCNPWTELRGMLSLSFLTQSDQTYKHPILTYLWKVIDVFWLKQIFSSSLLGFLLNDFFEPVFYNASPACDMIRFSL